VCLDWQTVGLLGVMGLERVEDASWVWGKQQGGNTESGGCHKGRKKVFKTSYLKKRKKKAQKVVGERERLLKGKGRLEEENGHRCGPKGIHRNLSGHSTVKKTRLGETYNNKQKKANTVGGGKRKRSANGIRNSEKKAGKFRRENHD